MINSKYTLLNDFEISGYWWLKRNKRNAVSGNLCFKSSSELSLELNGILGERQKNTQLDLILGISKNGQRYALLQNLCRQQSEINTSGFKTAIYKPRILIIGHTELTAKTIRLKNAEISLTGLEESTAAAWFKEQRTPNSTNIIWTAPDPWMFKIKKPNCTISLVYGVSTDGIHQSECTKIAAAQHTTSIKIAPNSPRSLDWYLNIFAELRNFLTILHGFPSCPKQISATTKIGNRIELFYPEDKLSIQQDPNIHDMFIRIQWLNKKTLGKVFRNWFTKSDGFSSVIQLVCGTMFQTGIYTRLEFANYIQALEAFHRNLNKGEFLTKVEYKPIRKVLIKAMPPSLTKDHKNKLISAINFGYQFDLRTRLTHLLSSVPRELTMRLTSDLNSFVNLLVDTRNYLTHYEKNPQKQIYSDPDLAVVNKTLRPLLVFLILREIGVPEQLALQRFFESKGFQIYEQLKHVLPQVSQPGPHNQDN